MGGGSATRSAALRAKRTDDALGAQQQAQPSG
jgi:hypothetical protein